ncbi:hypothetical protein [Halomonas sp. DN3]|uniref:hypothetical protein n=1 Tax=Halomonas sp. DN3 TaxID=2953657 RepID=UPI0020A17E5F|nr:hypothetical protein [Halomonas sp. DN3]USZ48181.1 hypothetical protein NKF27_11655 [Halomonas sp. DN3]
MALEQAGPGEWNILVHCRRGRRFGDADEAVVDLASPDAFPMIVNERDRIWRWWNRAAVKAFETPHAPLEGKNHSVNSRACKILPKA